MLTIRCECGEVFHADEAHIGRAIKCGRCGKVLGIGATPPAPSPPRSVEAPGSVSPAGPTASQQRTRRGWAVAGVGSLAAVIVVAAVFLSSPDPNRERMTLPSPLPQPADVPTRPTPQPLPSPTIPQPAPLRKFPPESQLRTTKPPVARLRTGTNIRLPLGRSGHGSLRINNGTSYDAAVTLLDADSEIARRFVYLRAGDVLSLTAIGPCRCRLFFALGTDWDPVAEEFREDSSFAVFDDPLRFTESERDYMTFSVTLHPVPEGRAKATPLSKEEFEQQIGRRHNWKGV